MPPALTADTGVDALTHALEALRLDLRLAVHRRVLPAGDQPDPRRAAARVARRRATCRRAPTWPTPRRSPGSRSPTRSSASTTRSRTPLGARFGIAHGRANGLFLPHVLRYNAALPRKFMPAPGYGAYVAPAEVRAGRLGPRARRAQRGRARASGCSPASTSCWPTVGMPRTLAELGHRPRRRSPRRCPTCAATPSRDPSLRTNPRMPLIAELGELLAAVARLMLRHRRPDRAAADRALPRGPRRRRLPRPARPARPRAARCSPGASSGA